MEITTIQLDVFYQRLSQNQVNSLPNGSIIYVLWSGGNGPWRYSILRDKFNKVCVDNIYNDYLDYVGIDKPKQVVWLVYRPFNVPRAMIAAMEYHRRTEDFDRKRCSFRFNDIIIPVNHVEYADSNNHRRYVLKELVKSYGISSHALERAISQTDELFHEELASSLHAGMEVTHVAHQR